MEEKNNERPIVMCHGLFGWGGYEHGGLPYFRCAYRTAVTKADRYYKKTTPPRLIFPSTGPVSSLHDQACELFYQLKGGTEDYGEEHSLKFGHRRFSRTYDTPLCPDWDAEHPLNFVGHSMGAPVIRMLQYLLESRFFHREDGTPYDTNAAWIRSITTVTGVNNGSTLAWILGCSEENGRIERTDTIISGIGTILEYYAKLQQKYSKLGMIYDLHLDHWEPELKPGEVRTPDTASARFRQITEDSSFFQSEDSAVYDLTPNAMEKWNPILKEYPDTWYFSYTASATFPFGAWQLPKPFSMRFFLFPFSTAQGFYTCKQGSAFKQYERYFRRNDGMCPAWTQPYPRTGRTAAYTYIRRKRPETFEKGIWNCMRPLRGRDHAEVSMMPHFYRLRSGDKLYKRIFDTIETLG